MMEEMKYYLSTEINAQNKLFTEFGGTYDFESAIKSVMKKFGLLTEEEVRVKLYLEIKKYKNISR